MDNSTVSSSSSVQQLESDKKQKSKELFLDTKGACFFCLQEMPENDNCDGDLSTTTQQPVNVGMTEVCLRNVCRHLNINPCTILLKTLQESLLINEEKAALQTDKCDFSVLLCPSCSSKTKKLSSLIRQVEVAKMLIDHHLEELERVLETCKHEGEEGEADISLWKKVQDKMLSANGSSVEVCLVENLRKETRNKCSLKVQTGFPNVHLRRVDENKKKKEKSQTASEDYRTNQDKNYEQQLNNLLSSSPSPTTVTIPPPILENNSLEKKPILHNPRQFTITTSQLISTVLAKFCEKYKHGNQFWYSCPSCTNIKPCPKSKILSHFANVHPEKLFSDRMLSDQKLPEVTFKSYCRQVLISEVKKARMQSSSKEVQHPNVLCHLCGYKSCSISYLKKHLILKHNKILEQKLSRLCFKNRRKDDDTKAVKTKNVIKRSEGRPLKIYSTKRKEKQKLSSIAQRIISQSKIKIMSKSKKIPYNQSKKNTIVIESPTTSSSTDAIVKQLIFDTCDNYFHRHGQQYECLICRKEMFNTAYRKHLVISHPETVFGSAKLSQTSENTFGQLCRKVMDSEAQKANREVVVSSSLSVFCPFCNRKFCRQYNLKYHFVLEHYAILKERIIEIQKNDCKMQDKNGEKILKEQKRKRARKQYKCNNNGCGEIFATYISFWKHRKYRCHKNTVIEKSPPATTGVENLITPSCKFEHAFPESSTTSKVQISTSPDVWSCYELQSWAIAKYCKEVVQQIDSNSESLTYPKLYRCSLCSRFKGMYHKSILFRHLLNIHPEKVFSHIKDEQLSEETFKACYLQVLKSEGVIKTEEVDSSFSRTQRFRWNCSYCTCSYEYKKYQNVNMRFHVVMKHYNNFMGKLVLAQQTKVVTGTGGVSKEKYKNDKDQTPCVNENSTQGKGSLQKDEILGSTNGLSKTRLFQILHKRWRMRKLKSLSNHLPLRQSTARQLSNHATYGQSEVPRSIESSNATSSMIDNCRKQAKLSSSIPQRNEIVLPQETEETSVLLDSNVKLNTTQKCTREITWSKSVMQLLSEICTKCYEKGERKYLCPFCSKFTEAKCVFKKHLANCHTEKFLFNADKFPNVSEHTFKQLCNRVLKLEIAHAVQQQKQSKRSTVQISCLYCHDKFRQTYSLRSHLVMQHSNILQEKLDSNFETEKLEKIKVNSSK